MLKEVLGFFFSESAKACSSKGSQKDALSAFSTSVRAKPIISLGTKEKVNYTYTAYIYKGCVHDICL